MKKYLLFLLLCTALVSQARTVPLPRGFKNEVYLPDATTLLHPGDTALLEGDYLFIRLLNIQGTKEQPIVFRNKGLVTVGGYPSYTCIFVGSYFRVLGNGDSQYKYGIRLGKQRGDSAYGAFGFGLGDSKGVEIAYCEFQYLSSGFLQNPATGQTMSDCYYHDNYLHNFGNPAAKGRSEGFYLGNTKSSTTRFENCRIENNLIENVTGDGIQVSRGSFIIKGNTVRKYAQAHLAMQRSGIVIGAEVTVDVLNNVIEDGGGVGMQIFGYGKIEVAGNIFRNIDVSNLPTEDIVYINGKSATPDNPLQINFHDNQFINVVPNRKIVFNGTSDEKNAGITFHRNKGLSSNRMQLSKKDRWDN